MGMALACTILSSEHFTNTSVLPAQPPCPRLPPDDTTAGYGRYHGFRFLQVGPGYPRAEVRFPLSFPFLIRLLIVRYSELAREKMWSRIHLIPMLQAEEDRDLVRRHLADQAREKELLGENVKVYNSDRYVAFSPIKADVEFRMRNCSANSHRSQICEADLCRHSRQRNEMKGARNRSAAACVS